MAYRQLWQIEAIPTGHTWRVEIPAISCTINEISNLRSIEPAASDAIGLATGEDPGDIRIKIIYRVGSTNWEDF